MFEFFVLCLVIVIILQYVYVGAILFLGYFYKKKTFYLNLIPGYWVRYIYRDLVTLIKYLIKTFKNNFNKMVDHG